MRDVIAGKREKYEEHVEYFEHDSHMDVITGDVHSHSSDRRRAMTRKVNLIYIGNHFVLSCCGSCPRPRSSFRENISVHAHNLRTVFCVVNVFKSIVKRYMVEPHDLALYAGYAKANETIGCHVNV